MTGARPPRRYVADGQALDDATRVAELRAALLDAQRWLMYAAGREAADEPGQAALLLQASADIEATLERTAALVHGVVIGAADASAGTRSPEAPSSSRTSS
ncbi:hypothetical protein ACIQGT_40995 [Streptomyces sp. NPDC093108]|uniref:hypothetical protein n=1 Tax=unclassified Streptomyces TaxID=2593676 RepID=UPI00380CA3C1